MKVREAWTRNAGLLERAGIPESSLEAEILVRHTLAIDRTSLFALLNDEFPRHREADLSGYVARRTEREPLAYILCRREFYGLDLYVTPAVLVPRPETELLVQHTLVYAGTHSGHLRVVDACTGSGAVAVAIASRLPGSTVYATDVSHEALAVAEVNRRRHRVADRVFLFQGDLLTPLDGSVDVIVSNSPYLRSDTLNALAPEVRREPRMALDGGPDGLDIIRRLFEQASNKLNPGGMLLCEIDPDQAEAVSGLGRRSFPDASVSCERDLSGLHRMIKVCLPPHSGAR